MATRKKIVMFVLLIPNCGTVWMPTIVASFVYGYSDITLSHY